MANYANSDFFLEIKSSRNSGRSLEAFEVSSSEKPAAANTLGWRFYAAFSCLCVINVVSALDASCLPVALPIIAEKLHGSGIEAFWSGTSFLLTATVFQPSFASFSEVFGRKPMLLIALTFFTVGSIIGALSNDFATLLVGRSIQGVGGGGIQALTNVIITDLVPLKERGKYVGMIAMTWAVGSVTGPIIGGVLSEKVSWRWIFWLNIPFCAVAYVMIPIFLNLKYKPGSFGDKLRQIDWIGSVLFVASTTSFLIPITWGGTMYAWNHWRTLVPLCVGVAGMVLFMLWSKYVTLHPILPSSLFQSHTSLTTYFGFVAHGMVQWSILFYMPLYFEAAKDMSAIKAGIALFPWTFTVAPTAVIGGVLVARTGRYRWAIWTGWLLVATGAGLLIFYGASTPAREWIPLALVSGLGLGMLYPSLSMCNQAAASAADMAVASALSTFFRNYGQMLGVAVGGSVLQNAMRAKLEKSSIAALAQRAASISKDISALVEEIKAMRHGVDAAKQAAVVVELVDAYCDALRVLWVVMGALACLALVTSLAFTKGYSLDRELQTDQGFVDAGKEAASSDEER